MRKILPKQSDPLVGVEKISFHVLFRSNFGHVTLAIIDVHVLEI